MLQGNYLINFYIMERNTRIEILRFILISEVCLWHIFIWGFNMRHFGHEPYLHESKLWIDLLICTFCSPAVYCFMFISGYYGIRPTLHKLLYLSLMGLSCLLIGSWMRWQFWGELNINNNIQHLFTITTNQWWFLTDYVIVFLFSPFISVAIEKIPKNRFLYIISLLTIMQLSYFVGVRDITGGSQLFCLFYVYIIGQLFSKWKIDIHNRQARNLFFLSFCMLYGILVLTTLHPLLRKTTIWFLSYANPLIMIMAISLFFYFKNKKSIYSPLINNLLSGILPIYLITEYLGKRFYRLIAIDYENNVCVGLAELGGVIIALLLLGFCVLKINNLIINFLLNSHLYKKVRNKYFDVIPKVLS